MPTDSTHPPTSCPPPRYGPMFVSCSGETTVLSWCAIGWGLSVKCRAPGCGIGRKWTCDDILDRLAGALGATMGQVAQRMVCIHCGSHDLTLSNFACAYLPAGADYAQQLKIRRRQLKEKAARIVAASAVPVIGRLREGGKAETTLGLDVGPGAPGYGL